MARILLIASFETLISKELLTTPLYLFPTNQVPLIDLILSKFDLMNLNKFLICGYSDTYLFLYEYIRKRFPHFDIIYWKIETRFDANSNEFGDIIRELARRILFETDLYCDYYEKNLYNNNHQNSKILIKTKKRFLQKEFDNLLIYQINTFTDFNLSTLFNEHKRNLINNSKTLFTTFLYKKNTEIHYIHHYGLKSISNDFKYRISDQCCEIVFYDTLLPLKLEPDIKYFDKFDGLNIFCISHNFLKIFYENFDYQTIEDLLNGIFSFNQENYKIYGLYYESDLNLDNERVIYSNQEMGFFEESEYVNVRICNSDSFVALKNEKEKTFLEQLIENKNELKYKGDKIEYSKKKSLEYFKETTNSTTQILPKGPIETLIKIPNLNEKINKILNKNQKIEKALLYSTIKYELEESNNLNGIKFYVKTITTLKDYYELNIDLKFFEQISTIDDIFIKRNKKRNLNSIGKNFSSGIKSVISNSIISDNCTVNSEISECVLWSNVTVTEPLNYCIVFDNNQIVSINDIDLTIINNKRKSDTNFKEETITFSESTCKAFKKFQDFRNLNINYKKAYIDFTNSISLLRIVYDASTIEVGEAFARAIVIDFLYFFNLQNNKNIPIEMESIFSNLLIYKSILKSYISHCNDAQEMFINTFFNELEKLKIFDLDFSYKIVLNLGYLLMCEDVIQPDIYKLSIKGIKKKVKKNRIKIIK